MNKISNIIRKNFEKRRKRTIKLMRYFMVGLFLLLCFAMFSGCQDTRHSIGVSAKPLSEKMDESVRLNYKIVFGKVRNKNEEDD